ncbi:STAS domain-containing protein [Gorillibacterium timonense]|uniref:STAS domain-containing protein n=1 Tax=Gorillibacterium timonense TaxID=1689269 RepID=UPI00071DB0C3|nr:STAS domain-containing protein [Gorillibacterium timonense]
MNRKKFDMTVKESSDNYTIYVSGELDLAVSAEFRSEIEPLLTSDKEVVLDMADLTYIDSTGMGIIIFFLKARKEDGKALSVQNVPQKIKKLFDLTGITRFLPVHGSSPETKADGV